MNRPQYLYLEEEDVDNYSAMENYSSPVIEYIAPKQEDHVVGGSTNKSHNTSSLHPDFLYPPSLIPEYMPPPRVVVFYAPW
jgi:hypothetical protein